MSLQAPIIYCQPEETARVARAAFPRGNTYMRIYGRAGTDLQQSPVRPAVSKRWAASAGSGATRSGDDYPVCRRLGPTDRQRTR